jgi:hypothetical protein
MQPFAWRTSSISIPTIRQIGNRDEFVPRRKKDGRLDSRHPSGIMHRK